MTSPATPAPLDMTQWQPGYHQALTAYVACGKVGNATHFLDSGGRVLLMMLQQSEDIYLSVPDWEGATPLTTAERDALVLRGWSPPEPGGAEPEWSVHAGWKAELGYFSQIAGECIGVLRDVFNIASPTAVTVDGVNAPTDRKLTLPLSHEEFEAARDLANLMLADLDMVRASNAAFIQQARPGTRLITEITRPGRRLSAGKGDPGEASYTTVMIGPGTDGNPCLMLAAHNGPTRNTPEVAVPMNPPRQGVRALVHPGTALHTRAILQGDVGDLREVLNAKPHLRAELAALLAAEAIEVYRCETGADGTVETARIHQMPERLDLATLRLPGLEPWPQFLSAVGAWLATACNGDRLEVTLGDGSQMHVFQGVDYLTVGLSDADLSDAQRQTLRELGWPEPEVCDGPQTWSRKVPWNAHVEYLGLVAELFEHVLSPWADTPHGLSTYGFNAYTGAAAPLPMGEAEVHEAWAHGRAREHTGRLRISVAQTALTQAYPHGAERVSHLALASDERSRPGAAMDHFHDSIFLMGGAGTDDEYLLICWYSGPSGRLGTRSFALQGTEEYVRVLLEDSLHFAADLADKPQERARIAGLLASGRPSAVRGCNISIEAGGIRLTPVHLDIRLLQGVNLPA